eukprot:scaffold1136_cov146-Cylindrotheca_fusiformis.AAC.1
MESTPITIISKISNGSNVQSPRDEKSLELAANEDDGLASEHGSAVSSVTEASQGSGSSVQSQPKSFGSQLASSTTMLRVNSSLVNKLAINKYNMEAVGLVGRECEIAILKSRFEAMMASDDGKEGTPEADSPSDPSSPSLVQSCAKKELIFIKGNSGVGKSSLAQTLKKHVDAQPNGVFVTGKFELNGADVPYSGIAKAFGEICETIKDLPQDSIAKVGAAISEAPEGEAETLFRLVPELNDVVSTTNTTSALADVTEDIEHGHERVKNALRALTRTMCSQFSPMVI